jgi:hypothetical protein
MGGGKAEEIKNFLKESGSGAVQQIIVDEHLTTKQIHNLEKGAADTKYILLTSHFNRIKTSNSTRRNKVSVSPC